MSQHMIYETKANAVVADRAIHHLIQARLGDGVPLIDAGSWMARIQQMLLGGHSHISDYPMSEVLAVAVEAGSEMEKELRSMALKLHLPFRAFDRPKEDDVGKWVVEVALSRAHEAFVDAAEARVAAASLREDFDRQQQAFQALENAVHDFGMPQFTLALDLPLTADRLVLSGGECPRESLPTPIDAAGHLIQRLPISARRIASVELHCELLAACSLDGKLEASISDLAGCVLAKSVGVNLSEISPGWNCFDFAEGIDCTDRDAVLHLSLSGTGAVALSLAPPTPIKRFHPSAKDAPPLVDSPLAAKVWRGLSGVRTQLPYVKMTEGSLIRRRCGEMPSARLYSIDGDPLGFDAVQYWAKEDGFLVHPPACGMTVGIIEGLDLRNFLSATAIVNNAHRDGSTLSFSLGIVPPGRFFHVPDVLGPWLTLPPLGWGEVHAALPEPASGQFDLVIATMVTKEQGNQKAWGLFRGFLLNADAV